MVTITLVVGDVELLVFSVAQQDTSVSDLMVSKPKLWRDNPFRAGVDILHSCQCDVLFSKCCCFCAAFAIFSM